MAKIILNNFLMGPGTLFILCLFTLFCIAAGQIWNHLRDSKWNRVIGTGCITLLILLFTAGMLFGREIKHDEIEHAHAAWLISQGVLPFNDFFQHHSPFFWILIAPLFKMPLVNAHICYATRIISLIIGALTLIVLYRFSCRLWGERSRFLLFAVLVCGHFLIIELNVLRPDLPANLLIFLALFLITGKRSVLNVFLPGILLGMTLALSLKYLPLMLILPFFLIVQKCSLKTIVRDTAIYTAGIITGIIPLFLWLYQHQLIMQFMKWVISFNASLALGNGRVIHVQLQLFLTLLGLAGCFLLLKSDDARQKKMGRLLACVVVFSAAIAMKPSKTHYEYYEQVYILFMIAASVKPLSMFLSRLIKDRKISLAAVCVALLLWPGVYETQRMIRSGAFEKGNRLIETLQRLTADEYVVCLPPRHPVTRFDACDISQGVQYTRWLKQSEIQNRLRNLPEQLIKKRPAVIFNRLDVDLYRRNFSEYIVQHEIISLKEKQALDQFIRMNYRLIIIEGTEFMLRRDIELNGTDPELRSVQ